MNQTYPLLDIAVDSQTALTLISHLLGESGLQVVRSFDLRAARSAHLDCQCPHHGTELCDCQLVVLLVYGSGPGPATLVAHGYDGRTQIALAHTPEQRPDYGLEDLIRQALLV
jgi:hypothetical protein